MKKNLTSILLLILAAVLAFSLSACNNENPDSSDASTVNSDASTVSSEASSDISQTEKPLTSENADDVSEVEKTGLWANATYLKDTEFGSGAKTAVVEVKIEGQTITFTVKTDKTTVGEALLEHKLIDGEEGAYGLYVKVVNGITADYDVDRSYWSFYINGEYAMTGVDATEIVEGATYSFKVEK